MGTLYRYLFVYNEINRYLQCIFVFVSRLVCSLYCLA